MAGSFGPTRYGRLQQPIYDSDQAEARADQASLRTAAGGLNAARGALGVAEHFGATKEHIERTIKGIELNKVLDSLREQLSPEQRVRIVIDAETNKVLSIERPGGGHFRDLSGKTKYFPLEGDDEGICRGNVTPDTTQFTVRERDGERLLKLFDERNPQAPEPPENDDGDKDDPDRETKRKDPQPLP